MLGKEVGRIGRISTEVEEPQGRAPSEVVAVLLAQITMIEIPVGDVVSRVAQDEDLKQSWDKIDPTLVDKPHLFGIDIAFAAQADLPEVEQVVCRSGHGDEAEVVRARSENGRLIGHLAVSRHR